jgi:hypothetical protein
MDHLAGLLNYILKAVSLSWSAEDLTGSFAQSANDPVNTPPLPQKFLGYVGRHTAVQHTPNPIFNDRLSHCRDR